MKKLFVYIAMAVFALSSCHTPTQVEQDIKNRKLVSTAARAELRKKADKAARQEAKKLSKQGWTMSPGALPIEKQLDRTYAMQYEYNSEGIPKYIVAEGMSIGSNYDAAKMQALELAKQNLAGQIQTEVTALIENTVANQQLESGDAASLTRSVASSKNIIAQSIGRVLPVVELYRDVNAKGHKNKEVLVRLAYSQDMVMETVKKAVKQDLENRGEKLHGQLDEILKFKQ